MTLKSHYFLASLSIPNYDVFVSRPCCYKVKLHNDLFFRLFGIFSSCRWVFPHFHFSFQFLQSGFCCIWFRLFRVYLLWLGLVFFILCLPLIFILFSSSVLLSSFIQKSSDWLSSFLWRKCNYINLVFVKLVEDHCNLVALRFPVRVP